jgi:hypothetical protein
MDREEWPQNLDEVYLQHSSIIGQTWLKLHLLHSVFLGKTFAKWQKINNQIGQKFSVFKSFFKSPEIWKKNSNFYFKIITRFYPKFQQVAKIIEGW